MKIERRRKREKEESFKQTNVRRKELRQTYKKESNDKIRGARKNKW